MAGDRRRAHRKRLGLSFARRTLETSHISSMAIVNSASFQRSCRSMLSSRIPYRCIARGRQESLKPYASRGQVEIRGPKATLSRRATVGTARGLRYSTVRCRNICRYVSHVRRIACALSCSDPQANFISLRAAACLLSLNMPSFPFHRNQHAKESCPDNPAANARA